MKKFIALLILIMVLPIISAVDPPTFTGLVAGKIDPNIKLLKNATITIVQQSSVIISGNMDSVEDVIVEYKNDAPIDGKTVTWEGYTSKYRHEQIGLDKLKDLAKNDKVLAIWGDVDTVPLTSCSWGSSSYSYEELMHRENVNALWDAGYTGKDVYVMVIDTGIQPSSNLDIAGGLRYGRDYSGSNHGTRSAQTIDGIAKDVKLYDCPAIGGGMPNDVMDCYDWAMTKKPNIISNSWAFLQPVSQDYIKVRKIKEASDSGIIVVFAASNCGSGCSYYPSCCDGTSRSVNDGCIDQDKYRGPGKSITGPNQLTDIITVAAVDAKTKEREGYSSQGPSYLSGGIYTSEKPDIAGYADFDIKVTDSARMNYAGTSAAAPSVAGAIALMIGANKNIGLEGIKTILSNTATPAGKYYDVGKGIVNVYQAVLQSRDYVSSECNCNDGDSCTDDTCNNGICSYAAKSPCCGNNQCEYGEGIWDCPSDCDLWKCKDNCQFDITSNDVKGSSCAPQCSTYCGDGSCNGNENKNTCSDDCGSSGLNVPLIIVISSVSIILIIFVLFRFGGGKLHVSWR